ncbi:hypothetical protein GW17_00048395 [Ensete ventricosum]|nr:hypothetical protein GW17_00048395 [Ensete ventricosum]
MIVTLWPRRRGRMSTEEVRGLRGGHNEEEEKERKERKAGRTRREPVGLLVRAGEKAEQRALPVSDTSIFPPRFSGRCASFPSIFILLCIFFPVASHFIFSCALTSFVYDAVVQLSLTFASSLFYLYLSAFIAMISESLNSKSEIVTTRVRARNDIIAFQPEWWRVQWVFSPRLSLAPFLLPTPPQGVIAERGRSRLRSPVADPVASLPPE